MLSTPNTSTKADFLPEQSRSERVTSSVGFKIYLGDSFSKDLKRGEVFFFISLGYTRKRQLDVEV